VSQPTIKQLLGSVSSGLSIKQGLTPNLVPYITFSPTLGIVAARINTLGTKVESFEEPLRKAVREVVIPSIQTNFRVGGRPAWPPHSPSTIEIRQRLGGGIGSLLVKTGALKAVMAQESIWTINKGMAILASLPEQVWYGNIHQGGYEGTGSGKSAKGKSLTEIVERALSGGAKSGAHFIPARPFAVLQPKDEQDIQAIFVEWLGDKIDEAWPGV